MDGWPLDTCVPRDSQSEVGTCGGGATYASHGQFHGPPLFQLSTKRITPQRKWTKTNAQAWMTKESTRQRQKKSKRPNIRTHTHYSGKRNGNRIFWLCAIFMCMFWVLWANERAHFKDTLVGIKLNGNTFFRRTTLMLNKSDACIFDAFNTHLYVLLPLYLLGLHRRHPDTCDTIISLLFSY